ncbi:MAG TPA: hypothetical protein VIU93_11590 [Gallionellaceae bacterium]
MKIFKRLLITPLVWLAAIVFLIEEFIWDTTARLMARLGALRYIHAVEKHITALPPRWAVIAFLLPSGILIPAKLIGLHAIAKGHWLLGGATFAAAKIAGMALFSRIFNLTRPTLLQVHWFARLYTWVMRYRNRIHAYLDQWAAYQRVRRKLVAVKFMFKGKGRVLRYWRKVRYLAQRERV